MQSPRIWREAYFIPIILDLLSLVYPACPPQDANMILKKIHNLERRLLEKLTASSQRSAHAIAAGNYCRDGPTGPPGDAGKPGDMGPKGYLGAKGFPGPRGDPCVPDPPLFLPVIKGYKGNPGMKGLEGPKGGRGNCVCVEDGKPCPMCSYFVIGSRGSKGESGDSGRKGIKGLPRFPGDSRRVECPKNNRQCEPPAEHVEVFYIPARRGHPPLGASSWKGSGME